MHAHMPWYDETMSCNDSTRTTLAWGHRGDVAQQPPRWHGVFNKLNTCRRGENFVRGFFRRGKFRTGKIIIKYSALVPKIKGKIPHLPNLECIANKGDPGSLPMSRHVSRHTFRCPPPPSPPPPPCHGGTAGTGDTGDTSAKPPPTRTIAWHTVPSPPPPPPSMSWWHKGHR